MTTDSTLSIPFPGHFEATDNKSDIFYDCQSLPENSENQGLLCIIIGMQHVMCASSTLLWSCNRIPMPIINVTYH